MFVKRSEGPLVETTVARRAHYTVSSDGQSETITLYDGERIEGTPGQQSLPHHALRPAADSDPHARDRRGARRAWMSMSTAQLLASRDPKLRAELQWRLGLPIMTLVLTALAVPLGRLRPRQGRYAHVWIAVLVFALLRRCWRSQAAPGSSAADCPGGSGCGGCMDCSCAGLRSGDGCCRACARSLAARGGAPT